MWEYSSVLFDQKIGYQMKEIDVALTDYGLALLCFVAAYMILGNRSGNRTLALWFSILFSSVGLAAFIGGTVHGFVHENTLVHAMLWRGTIICIGVSALSAWVIGANIIFSPGTRRIILGLASINFIMYFAYVVLFNQSFGVAVVNYLPAALFLMIVFANAYKRSLNRLALFALIGLISTFIAAGIQQLEISLHTKYFNHNALYHVVQAGGLYLIFLGSRDLVKKGWHN